MLALTALTAGTDCWRDRWPIGSGASLSPELAGAHLDRVVECSALTDSRAATVRSPVRPWRQGLGLTVDTNCCHPLLPPTITTECCRRLLLPTVAADYYYRVLPPTTGTYRWARRRLAGAHVDRMVQRSTLSDSRAATMPLFRHSTRWTQKVNVRGSLLVRGRRCHRGKSSYSVANLVAWG